MTKNNSYIETIMNNSMSYLKTIFSSKQLDELLSKISYLNDKFDSKKIIREWSNIYIDFIKVNYQNSYEGFNKKLNAFIRQKDDGVKVVWGDCLKVIVP